MKILYVGKYIPVATRLEYNKSKKKVFLNGGDKHFTRYTLKWNETHEIEVVSRPSI